MRLLPGVGANPFLPEPPRVGGFDRRPDAAAKTGAEAGGAKGAKLARQLRQRDRLRDLVAEKDVGIALRIGRQLAERVLVGVAKRDQGERAARALANEVIEPAR